MAAMPYSVLTTDLRSMTVDERNQALAAIVQQGRGAQNGERAILNARIRAFEERYEISSADLREALRVGRMKETAEVARWLFWLDARDRSG
jgi:hypothetical protein